MKNKIVWMVVSFLMVLSLILASCAPAAPPEEVAPPVKEVAPPVKEVAPPVKEVAPAAPEKVMVKDSLGRLVEKPQYGGTVNFPYARGVFHFDPIRGNTNIPILYMTHEKLLMPDLLKGPNGTREWVGLDNVEPRKIELFKPHLAESWEFTDEVTIVIHLRKGVHFALDPRSEASRLVNGREVTADDVAFSIKCHWEDPNAYNFVNRPGALASVTAPDKYTVIAKAPSIERTNELFLAMMEGLMLVFPRDAYEKYNHMADWRNLVGSGPFILTDFVWGSSATLERNPNWWFHDPFFPENQLPYLDRVRWLFIMDRSTRLAALRTGKLDQMGGEPDTSLTREDALSIMKTNPELKWVRKIITQSEGFLFKGLSAGVGAKPFDDIRVRYALAMGIDRQAIARDYYGGDADILAYPVANTPEFVDAYTPLEQLPPSIRELFEYNPDKAKKLLAEAGYPNGFETSIVLRQEYVDLMSIVKADWEKIGVKVRLDVKEPAVLNSMLRGGTFTQLGWAVSGTTGGVTNPTCCKCGAKGSTGSGGMCDWQANEDYTAMQMSYFDYPKRFKILKDMNVRMLGLCYAIALPAPYTYHFWQPWLKGYSGEYIWSYCGRNAWFNYVWVDQELKESMTGTR